MVQFECSGCSLCCKRVGKAVKEARKWMLDNRGKRADARTKAVASFPFKTNEKGWCEKLGADGQCSIYETRPDVCNVEKSFEKFGGTRTREGFFEDNAKLCNAWIRKAGLDESFLVKEDYLTKN